MYLAAPSGQLQIPSNDWTSTYDTLIFSRTSHSGSPGMRGGRRKEVCGHVTKGEHSPRVLVSEVTQTLLPAIIVEREGSMEARFSRES